MAAFPLKTPTVRIFMLLVSTLMLMPTPASCQDSFKGPDGKDLPATLPPMPGQKGSAPDPNAWLQKPLIKVEQLPPGFYYVFREGDEKCTYMIKIPDEQEKKQGEIPYIENREQARSIDEHYGRTTHDPRLTWEETKDTAAELDGAKKPKHAAMPAYEEHAMHKKKPAYWSALKSLPKSASHSLFGDNPEAPKPIPYQKKTDADGAESSDSSAKRPAPYHVRGN